jgi:hypothetical protein
MLHKRIPRARRLIWNHAKAAANLDGEEKELSKERGAGYRNTGPTADDPVPVTPTQRIYCKWWDEHLPQNQEERMTKLTDNSSRRLAPLSLVRIATAIPNTRNAWGGLGVGDNRGFTLASSVGRELGSFSCSIDSIRSCSRWPSLGCFALPIDEARRGNESETGRKSFLV